MAQSTSLLCRSRRFPLTISQLSSLCARMVLRSQSGITSCRSRFIACQRPQACTASSSSSCDIGQQWRWQKRQFSTQCQNRKAGLLDLEETMAKKSAMIILADGAEEMEAVITIDVLRRAGVEVTVAGLLGKGPVRCARQTVITPEVALSEAKERKFDAVILPGGQPGSNSLAASDEVGAVLRAQHDAGRLVAAICAAPIALKSHGIAPGSLLTSHPGVQQKLVDGGYKYSEDRVVAVGNVVTSRGPGTAFEFALKLVELLVGAEKVREISAPMILKL